MVPWTFVPSFTKGKVLNFTPNPNLTSCNPNLKLTLFCQPIRNPLMLTGNPIMHSTPQFLSKFFAVFVLQQLYYFDIMTSAKCGLTINLGLWIAKKLLIHQYLLYCVGDNGLRNNLVNNCNNEILNYF